MHFTAEKHFPNSNIKETIIRLIHYCRANQWAGYDPYDGLNSRLFDQTPLFDSKIFRLIMIQFLKRCPFNLRPFLLVPKKQNPKAIALFLMSFLKLSKLGLLEHESLIEMVIERLIALRSPNTPYWCWGYSFPWQGRIVLASRGAANLVCTVFVANALLDLYESQSYASSEAVLQQTAFDGSVLPIASNAAEYILNELYWEDVNGDAGFCYPVPTFKTRVHNANFLAAALFSRIYKHSGEKKYLEPALKAARYSAGKQLPDGSWYYGEHEVQQWIDNFHTGYNLGALKTICTSLNTDEFEPYIRRGFDFYINNFFTSDNLPKYFNNRIYPIDIHAVAQSIITLVEFKDYNENAMDMATKICLWTIENMQDKKGYFYYQKKKYYTNKISYMRWSQAWMLYALAIFKLY